MARSEAVLYDAGGPPATADQRAAPAEQAREPAPNLAPEFSPLDPPEDPTVPDPPSTLDPASTLGSGTRTDDAEFSLQQSTGDEKGPELPPKKIVGNLVEQEPPPLAPASAGAAVQMVKINDPAAADVDAKKPPLAVEVDAEKLASRAGGSPTSPTSPTRKRTLKLQNSSIADVAQAAKMAPAAALEGEFVERSLNLMSEGNFVRRPLLWLHRKSVLEQMNMLLIILNGAFLGIYDPSDDDPNSKTNRLQNVASWFFAVAFTIEMFIRIIVFGLVQHKNAYLRNGWNRMELFVVILGWVNLIPGAPMLTAFRTLGLLRIIRRSASTKGMRVIVNTLLVCGKPLLRACTLLAFTFTLFCILGVELFAGSLRGRCYTVDAVTGQALAPVVNATLLSVPPNDRACSVNGGGHACDTGQVCIYTEYNPQYGFLSWDNFGWAFVSVFQIGTCKAWSDIMYRTADAVGKWAYAYFLVQVVAGSQMVLNLALAVIADNLHQQTQRADEALAAERALRAAGRKFSLEKEMTLSRRVREYGLERWRRVRAFCRARVEADRDRTAMLSNADPAPGTLARRVLLRSARSWAHHTLMWTAVLYNAVVCCTRHDGQSAAWTRFQDGSFAVLTVLFALEVVWKATALGFWQYLSDPYHQIDVCVAVATCVEWAVRGGQSVGQAGLILAAFRVLRMYKAGQHWTAMGNVLRGMSFALSTIGPLLVVTFIIIYICAILGMQFFGGRVPNDGLTRYNFDNLYWAMLTTFVCMTTDNWQDILHNTQRGVGWYAAIFFIPYITVLIYIVLNLVLALLIEGFNVCRQQALALKKAQSVSISAANLDRLLAETHRNRAGAPSDAESYAERRKALLARLGCKRPAARVAPTPDDRKANQRGAIVEARENGLGASWRRRQAGEASAAVPVPADAEVVNMTPDASQEDLNLPPSSSKGAEEGGPRSSLVREAAYVLAESREYGIAWTLLLLMSSASLAVYRPDLAGRGQAGLGRALDGLEIFYCVAFGLNVALGTLGSGRAWWRRGAHRLEALAFVSAVLGIGIPEEYQAASKVWRCIRPVRCLCFIPRFEGPALVMTCILRSLPAFGPVIAIAFPFLLSFGIIGVALYAGTFGNCSDNVQPTFDTCMAIAGNTWVNSSENFDNMWRALVTLFNAATQQNWSITMANAIDAVGPGISQVTFTQPAAAIYFVAYECIVAFFVMNVFIGVILDTFTKVRLEANGDSLLSNEQREWVGLQKTIMRLKPRVRPKAPRLRARRALFRMVMSDAFDHLVLAAVIVNTVYLAVEHFDYDSYTANGTPMAPGWMKAFQVLDAVFVFFFVADSLLRIVALGPKQFWRDPWNRFDLFVSVVCLIGYFTTFAISLTIIRTFRLARLVKVIKRSGAMRQLLLTFYYSAPSFINVGYMLAGFFFFFSMVGTELFTSGGDPPSSALPNLTDQANFWDFGSSFLMLFRMATGENYDSVMFDLFNWGFTYQAVVIVYCLTYQLSMNLILTNLFCAVVLDSFDMAAISKDAALDDELLDAFVAAWSKYDPMASGVIRSSDLVLLVAEKGMRPPLAPADRSARAVREFAAELELPERGGRLVFAEVLDALVAHADLAPEELPAVRVVVDLVRSRQRYLQSAVKGKPQVSGSVQESLAALNIQRVWRGRVARRRTGARPLSPPAGPRAAPAPPPPIPEGGVAAMFASVPQPAALPSSGLAAVGSTPSSPGASARGTPRNTSVGPRRLPPIAAPQPSVHTTITVPLQLS